MITAFFLLFLLDIFIASETITQVLQKILDKMDMAASVDKILLIAFDFWQYGSKLINQMKVKDHDKPKEKRIRKKLSQQKCIPAKHESWRKVPIYGI